MKWKKKWINIKKKIEWIQNPSATKRPMLNKNALKKKTQKGLIVNADKKKCWKCEWSPTIIDIQSVCMFGPSVGNFFQRSLNYAR